MAPAPPSIGSTSKSTVVADVDAVAAKRQKKHKSKKGKERALDQTQLDDAEEAVVESTLEENNGSDGRDENSNFKLVRAVMRLPLAPVFAEDPLDGVKQCLESWVMRYLPAIDAVLLTVSWPPEFLEENATLAPSSAFGLARVRWEGVGFRPQVGKQSTGKLSLATPSLISLLLHNLFNASIAADQIPQDTYEWDADAILPYSLAPPPIQASPARAPPPAPANTAEEPVIVEDAPIEEEQEVEPERGCWVHKKTREPLGGKDGKISFTVIGLTIANSMISVHGSLLPSDATSASSKSTKDKQRHNGQSSTGPESTGKRKRNA